MEETSDQNCIKCQPLCECEKKRNPDLHVELKLDDCYLIAQLHNQYNENIELPGFPLTYQFNFIKYKWYRNGRYIKGAHDQKLYIGNDSCENNYKVKVKYEVESITVMNSISTAKYVINDNVNGNIVLNASITNYLKINGDVSGTIVFNANPIVASTGKLVINGQVFGQATINITNNNVDIDGIFINGNSKCGGVQILFNSNGQLFLQISQGGRFDNYNTLSNPNITNNGTLNNYGTWKKTSTSRLFSLNRLTNNNEFNNYGEIMPMFYGISFNNNGKTVNHKFGVINCNDFSNVSGSVILKDNSFFNTYGYVNSAITELYDKSAIICYTSVFVANVSVYANIGTTTLNNDSSIIVLDYGSFFNNGKMTLNDNSYLVISGFNTQYNISGTFILNDHSSLNIELSTNSTATPTLVSGIITIGHDATINLSRGATLYTDPTVTTTITNNGTITLYSIYDEPNNTMINLQTPENPNTTTLINNGKIYSILYGEFIVSTGATFIGNPVINGNESSSLPIVLSGKIYGRFVDGKFKIYGSTTGVLSEFNFKHKQSNFILDQYLLSSINIPVKLQNSDEINQNSTYLGHAKITIYQARIDYCQTKMHLTIETPNIPLPLCCPTKYKSKIYQLSDCVTFKFKHFCH
jgi:hypothetical protein